MIGFVSPWNTSEPTLGAFPRKYAPVKLEQDQNMSQPTLVTLFGIVIRGVAPGNSQLSIVQVNSKNSQQQPIKMVTQEAGIRVQ